MATVTTAPSIPNRPTYSCIRCADRKVKHKRVKDQALTDRLKVYEALLREKGIDPCKLPDTPDTIQLQRSIHVNVTGLDETRLATCSSEEAELNRNVHDGRVNQDHGQAKIIDNILWERMVEELPDRQHAWENFSNDVSDAEESENDFGFVLGGRLKESHRSRHPLPQGILQLWQIFIENVDPLTKVLHVLTLQPTIEKAASNTEVIPRSFEALLFAIYSAAIMSLNDDECNQRLHERRKILLSRYVTATKRALSRANFMGSTNLVVLQALVLHLISTREIYEPRAFWSLMGVAVRVAQGMGLDRDGTTLGLPPFETEIRRRIWWLLQTHDFRAAELCGIAKFQSLQFSAEKAKWPTNINDDQLHPGMPSLVSDTNTITDALFVCLKCEFVDFIGRRIDNFSRQGKPSSQWELHAPESDTAEMDTSFGEIEQLLETKYLRYCDPSQPLHLMAMLMVRCSINTMRFLSRHPRKWSSLEQTPQSERQWVWEICVRILEQHNMLQCNPQLKRFAWYGAYFQQWHAIIHVLESLRTSPLMVDAEKAWRLIGSMYDNAAEMTFDMRKPIHAAVGNLCLKAYAARETAMRNSNIGPPALPPFIVQLRQQREKAQDRRQARSTKSSQLPNLVDDGQARVSRTRPATDIDDVFVDETSKSATTPRNTASETLGFDQTNGTSVLSETELFWFNQGFDDSHFDHTNDAVGMDFDFMLDQDHDAKGSTTHGISWDQWDSWLADSNLIRSLSPDGRF
ncbi:hypothetical protein TruAng_004948 [Truncatella angustata]|nr:hypothetical protein TruAng_004948 [Truncatella angustata]